MLVLVVLVLLLLLVVLVLVVLVLVVLILVDVVELLVVEVEVEVYWISTHFAVPPIHILNFESVVSQYVLPTSALPCGLPGRFLNLITRLKAISSSCASKSAPPIYFGEAVSLPFCFSISFQSFTPLYLSFGQTFNCVIDV